MDINIILHKNDQLVSGLSVSIRETDRIRGTTSRHDVRKSETDMLRVKLKGICYSFDWLLSLFLNAYQSILMSMRKTCIGFGLSGVV